MAVILIYHGYINPTKMEASGAQYFYFDSCEHVDIHPCSGFHFMFTNCSDVWLKDNTIFSNTIFKTRASNVYGENITFNYKKGFINWTDWIDIDQYKEYVFTTVDSKCFIDGNSKIIDEIPNNTALSTTVKKFNSDRNSQCTWLDSQSKNFTELLDKSYEQDMFFPETVNKVTEVNHQHVFAEIDNTKDVISSMYIGYPMAWLDSNQKPTAFKQTDLNSCLIPLPPNWKPVTGSIQQNYILLDTVNSIYLSGVATNLLGKSISFYVPGFGTSSSSNGDVSTTAQYKIFNANDMIFQIINNQGNRCYGFTFVQFNIRCN